MRQISIVFQLMAVIKTILGINLSLNGNDWFVFNNNKSIKGLAQVPGSIYTDLIRNNVLKEDPYFGSNDLNYRWVAFDNWTYHKYFNVDDTIVDKRAVFLVCHGLDTVATVSINRIVIGYTDNMFVRYKFDIKPYLRSGLNEISISFESPVTYANNIHDNYIKNNYIVPPESMPFVQRGELHVNYIRKMQSSFSWDWGPAFPTQGIWKDIEIEAYDSVLLRDVTVTTIASNNNKWTLNATLYLEAALKSPFEALIQISIYNSVIYRKLIELNPSFDSTVSLNILVNINDSIVIHKWYPNGIGSQTLYDLSFIVTTTEDELRKTLKIGFRTIELIQIPIESKGLTFYFNVNGIPFYSKGSNWIPAHVFQEQLTPDYIRELLESCKNANMNMLRVWGGGVYESNIFYQIADELGILIWHDFMFACALYPVDQHFLSSVKEEVTQQIRRLQYHPSIALWAGNNENEAAIAQMWWPEIFTHQEIYKRDYITLYVNTIGKVVLENDISRPYLTSSPSNGMKTIKDNWISSNPQDNRFGDVHFYYYGTNAWDWRTYPSTRFASEYGFQSFPSLKSISKVVNSSDLRFPLSDAISQRQHQRNGNKQIIDLIENYMKLPTSGGSDKLDDFIYLTQISQSMSLKTETEFYRRNRAINPQNGEGFTMGALYWQLNDIWSGAPSWSSIEFGGKWKMSHYFIKNVFKPLLVVPFEENNQLRVALVRDDYSGPLVFDVIIRVWKWSAMKPSFEMSKVITTQSISSEIVFEELISELMSSGDCLNRNECLIETIAQNIVNNWRTNNYLLLSSIRNAIGIKRSDISVKQMTGPHNFVPDFVYQITIESKCIALFVWLDFTLDSDIMGQFSDNGFIMVSPIKIITFFSKTPTPLNYLRTHLTIKTLNDLTTN